MTDEKKISRCENFSKLRVPSRVPGVQKTFFCAKGVTRRRGAVLSTSQTRKASRRLVQKGTVFLGSIDAILALLKVTYLKFFRRSMLNVHSRGARRNLPDLVLRRWIKDFQF